MKRQLLERGNTEHAIRDALRASERGEGSAVLLLGAPGVGKTAMLAWAAQRGSERGFAVAEALASQMERSLPFGLLGQAIVALGGNPAIRAQKLIESLAHPKNGVRTPKSAPLRRGRDGCASASG